jgi:uncharacterized protein YndB with AHSA1/START domain
MPFTSSTSIAHQTLIGPIDPVYLWLVLTDPEATPFFFLKCSFRSDFKPGSRYTLSVGDVVMADGEILEYEPPTTLLMTFNQRWNADIAEPASRVRFYVDPQPPLCELVVIHDGLTEHSPLNADLNKTWLVMSSALKTLLETGKELPLRDESREQPESAEIPHLELTA